MRIGHIFYIDKTDFIREWRENADKVTLITRPRRFGKTLNMSMIECFFQYRTGWCAARTVAEACFGRYDAMLEPCDKTKSVYI